MNRSFFTKGTESSKLIKMLMITAFFALLSSLTASVVWLFLNGKLSETGIMRILQVIQSVGIFIVPSAIGTWLFYDNRYTDNFGSFKKISPSILSVSIIIMISSTPLISWASYINTNIPVPEALADIWQWMKEKESAAIELTRTFLSGSTATDYAANILIMALLPAIGEEWLFRGMIQPMMARATKNSDIAILITAIIFSALHFQFLTFVPRVILGVILGYLFYLGKNLWLPIAAHFINNFVAFAAYKYYESNPVNGTDPLLPSTSIPNAALTVASLIIVMVGLYTVDYLTQKRV